MSSKTIHYTILVIVWEDMIDILDGKPSILIKKLLEKEYADYLREDFRTAKIRLSSLKYLEEDLKDPIKLRFIQSKGWNVSIKHTRITE